MRTYFPVLAGKGKGRFEALAAFMQLKAHLKTELGGTRANQLRSDVKKKQQIPCLPATAGERQAGSSHGLPTAGKLFGMTSCSAAMSTLT